MTIIERIQERFTSSLVFGDLVESDGVVVLPAARVMGGGGGGKDDKGDEGGGFGLSASPVGAWVIEDGRARWKPSPDVSRLAVGGYLVVIAYLYFTWRTQRARIRRSS